MTIVIIWIEQRWVVPTTCRKINCHCTVGLVCIHGENQGLKWGPCIYRRSQRTQPLKWIKNRQRVEEAGLEETHPQGPMNRLKHAPNSMASKGSKAW